MKYAGIIKNDFAAAPGTCVTFFVQGCPHRCKNCHNPETWDFNGGKDFDDSVILELLQALTANGIHRDFCIMGGEPMCLENQYLTLKLVNTIKKVLPETKIYVWSGYTIDELAEFGDECTDSILDKCDVLIDGRYIDEEKDITLFMRGSRNQNIINLN